MSNYKAELIDHQREALMARVVKWFESVCESQMSEGESNEITFSAYSDGSYDEESDSPLYSFAVKTETIEDL